MKNFRRTALDRHRVLARQKQVGLFAKNFSLSFSIVKAKVRVVKSKRCSH